MCPASVHSCEMGSGVRFYNIICALSLNINVSVTLSSFSYEISVFDKHSKQPILIKYNYKD